MQILINHSLINYLELNPKQKKTVVILHGWGQTGSFWLPLAKLLPPTHRYLILDLPGFGGSDHLPDNPDVPQYSHFLKDFLDKLKISRPTIIGHSFGGQIAMDFALTYPEQLSSLILISPAGIRQTSSKTTLKKIVYQFFKPVKFITPSPIQKLLRPLFTSQDYINAIGKQKDILKLILRYDLSHRLNQITVPTHIIWGDLDYVIPYQGKLLAENIPDSTLHVLYGAEHNPHIYKTQALADTLIPLL